MAGQNSAKSLSLAEPLSTWKARCPEKLEMHVTKIPGLGISGNTTLKSAMLGADCDTKRVGASLPHGLAGLARGASLATAERLRPPAYAQPRQGGHHLADRTPPSAAIAGASAIGAALRRWLTGEAPSYANTENGPLLAWSRGAARKVLSSRLMCPRSPNYISANHEKPMRVKCRWRNADRLIEKSLMTACAHRVKFGTVAPAES